MNNTTFSIKKLLPLGLLICVILISIGVYLKQQGLFQKKDTALSPSPSQQATPEKLLDDKKTAIGETTENAVAVLPGVKTLGTTPDGIKKFSVVSDYQPQENQIWTKNGTVIFEQVNVQTFKYGKLLDLSEIKKRFGEPEEVIEGVQPYTLQVSAYLYPKRGLTVIANNQTGSVYELHYYIPMENADYKKTFAEFIEKTGPIIERWENVQDSDESLEDIEEINE